MHISSEILSAKFHVIESSVKSAIKNLFASLHSVSDIKMTSHKPAEPTFKQVNLCLDEDVNQDQSITFRGYCNNFRGNKEDAILLHGHWKDGLIQVGGKAAAVIENNRLVKINGQVQLKTDLSEAQCLNAQELVAYINKKSGGSVDLLRNNGPIHLVSCFAKRQAAQDLADVTGRPVIAYSNQQTITAGYNYIHNKEFNIESKLKHAWDPRAVIMKKVSHQAVPKTFYPSGNGVK
ncbi:TPA: hypothetical protein OOF55_002362 [Morganella morganii]|nr:hypothetical protein [Morganella morganii]